MSASNTQQGSDNARRATEEPARAALDDLVAQSDTGARHPHGPVGTLLLGVALAWSLFQLWYASPLPFVFNVLVLNDTEARAIHLAFAIFLAYLAYPAFARSPRDHVPLLDWAFALIGAFSAAYIYLFYDSLASRPGNPNTFDLIVAIAGMVLLLEATRRSLGPPLTIVALVFLSYIFLGPYMPDILAYKGASVQKAMSHLWLTTEGVFGIALGVSTSFVFVFVLFGSLLDKAGAGNYFIKVAFALLGHLRGGPAKAAVLSSGMTGLISGSSIANVVTTGTFTIPLMKRVGFTAEKAGAVEVASSVNGQIMPPVMGAAAFLMVEYVGIPYVDVIKHAIVPALISYIALLYIVHLEALKADMQGLPRQTVGTWQRALLGYGIIISSLIIISGAVYYGIGWLKTAMPDSAMSVVLVSLLIIYAVLLVIGAREPELEIDDPNAPVVSLPAVGPTVRSGLHFLLPVVVLVWCLMIERLSPGLSAFYACALMIFILLTQRPALALLRGRASILAKEFFAGLADLIAGLIAGARNMIGIGIATATAGIIVGTVTLTGVGLKMTEFIEFISGGILLLMLFFVAIISLVLGMGLPTTANYIVVSTLMAPVVVELGAQNGLLVPLIAVHLFVFYFGIMADVTPPVGLASFAAAAVSGGDPIRTGFTAFFYSLRTAALPFIFIFNTELLLIGVESWAHALLIVLAALIAMLVFAAGTMGYFFTRSRIYETIALLLVAFTLFRPGFWMDMIFPPLTSVPPSQIEEMAADPANERLRLRAEGMNIEGNEVSLTVMMPLGDGETGVERLAASGLELRDDDGRVVVDMIGFGSPAEKLGLDFDYEITQVLVPNERPSKEWMFIPALALLAGIIWLQRRRITSHDAPLTRAQEA